MRIVVMLAGMVLVSACGNEPNSGRNTAEDSKTEARKDYTKEPAELVFFGVPAGPAEAWDEKVGNAMRKRFPDYKKRKRQKSVRAGFEVQIQKCG
jgi:hypothetical protein